jgi:glutamate-1-semialdehyde 2,1-aminomutase
MPAGAIGGKAIYMTELAPLGPVYQAGTLAGNPVAMTAGLATLEEIAQPGFYTTLSKLSHQLMQGFTDIANRLDIPMQTSFLGGMFGFCFTHEPPRNYADVACADAALFKRFYHQMLKRGIYLAPSMYEAGFVSAAHTPSDIEKTLMAFEEALFNEQEISKA